DNNKNIISSNGFKASIDTILNLNEDDYSPTKNYINEISELGLMQFIKKIEARFLLRDNKINGLKASLSKEHFNALNNFNYIVKAKNISQIPFYALKLNNDELSLLDSYFQSIKEKTDLLNSIESSFSLSIYSFLLRYDAYKKNMPVSVFWDYAFNVDQRIQNSSYYLPYLFLLFENGYNDPQLPKKITAKIDSLKTNTPSLDTFLNVISVLDHSLVNFDKSKAELANISNGKYMYFMESEENRQRNITKIDPIQITNMADEKIDFKKILFDDDSKITVIDFWASWCIPCIEEYPEFKEAKKKLTQVRFINISIDKDEASEKWKNKVNNLNGTNIKDQYRLADLDSKALYNYFNIGPIPRYVVFDKTGKILAFDFFRPKDPNFQNMLNLMVNNAY
ncbi:MAG: TlpA family protein disulfide reductase, partial [Pedobacter sp.]